MMPDPVICPNCGERYASYPAWGKCVKCGGVIPGPGARPSAGIDEELARLGSKPKTCPTCGKELPSGVRACPDCRQVQTSRERHGWPGWLKLLLVLLFAAVATTVTVIVTKKWSHEKNEKWVQADLDAAGEAEKAGRFSEAAIALERAKKQLDGFDPDDPTRSDLASEIDKRRRALRDEVEEKLKALIKKGDDYEAERFYEAEAKNLDSGDIMRKIVDKALANRKALLKFRSARDKAVKLRDSGKPADALRELSALRTEVQDPSRARGDSFVGIRTEVEALQTAWVKEACAKGTALLDEGKIAEATGWFETAREFVWVNEVALRREIEDTLSRIADKRVMGLILNVGAVRVVKPEDVRAELIGVLRRKLSDEGMVMLALSGRSDPKAGELQRILVVDYREDRTRSLSSDAGERAVGTKITCTVKIISASDGKTVWEEKDPVTAQTGVVGGLAKGEFNDANLRLSAVRTFQQALDAVRIATRDVMP